MKTWLKGTYDKLSIEHDLATNYVSSVSVYSIREEQKRSQC